MGFIYNKNKNNGDGFEWGTYSDLFANLSFVFLMLFAVAQLRMGTSAISMSSEHQKLVQENQDLKQQIKVYETLKDQYMQQQATADEVETYKSLMDKLSLLQDEASTERDSLRNQAKQLDEKEKALNQYQQMVRNIINSNMLAQSRIKRRDNIIQESKETIKDLKNDISEKEKVIANSESEIKETKKQLDKQVKKLKYAYENNQITKKAFEKQTQALKAESEQKIQELSTLKEEMQSQVASLSSQFENVSEELSTTKKQVEEKTKESIELQKKLQFASTKHSEEIEKLKAESKKRAEQDKQKFESELKKEQLTAQARQAKEKEFKSLLEKRERDLSQKLTDLDNKYKATSTELKKAQEGLEAKKKLASEIQKKFKEAGIKAEVNPGTGDVILDFGEHYFDTDKSKLKPEMQSILQKALPAYAQSLFSDEKISQKISSVEIVGFASPTFNGKYVDPKSLDEKSRQAVNYNLDLSFNRAKSIFQYAFDTKKMSFEHQKRLLPLVKVTGRSFLSDAEAFRNPASSDDEKDFCKKYNCKKAQRVMVKFYMKD